MPQHHVRSGDGGGLGGGGGGGRTEREVERTCVGEQYCSFQAASHPLPSDEGGGGGGLWYWLGVPVAILRELVVAPALSTLEGAQVGEGGAVHVSSAFIPCTKAPQPACLKHHWQGGASKGSLGGLWDPKVKKQNKLTVPSVNWISSHFKSVGEPEVGGCRDASEGKGPQRQLQRRLGRRLEEVAEAVGGGYCR